MTGQRAVIIALGLFVAVLIPIWLGGSGPGDQWRKIMDNQLDERFSGMTFFGTIPAELSEPSAFSIRAGRIMYYHSDGTLTTSAGWNQVSQGTWRIIDGKVCHFKSSEPSDSQSVDDDCWTAFDGEGEVLLWRSAEDQWVGALSPGNQVNVTSK